MKHGIADSGLVSSMSTTTTIHKSLVEIIPESCTSPTFIESGLIICLYGVNKKLKNNCLKSLRDSFFLMLTRYHNREGKHPDKSIPVTKFRRPA